MDRDAIVRGRRRDQALEALDFERQRELALADEIADLLVERDGRRVDEEAFRRMDAADVGLVRELLEEAAFPDEELEADGAAPEEDDAGADAAEDELARLQEEVAACRERQRALERYLEALGS